MPYIEWDNSFSVGIEEIDNQHKGLCKTINELYDAMREGKGTEILGEILNRLIDYTKTHFKTEEKYFTEYGYPDTEKHKQAHQEFVKKVTEFQTDFENGNAFITIKIMDFLSDWLIHHIKGMDQEYAPFLRDKIH